MEPRVRAGTIRRRADWPSEGIFTCVRRLARPHTIIADQADYKEAPVSQTQAYRALRRSRSLVAAVEAGRDTAHEQR